MKSSYAFKRSRQNKFCPISSQVMNHIVSSYKVRFYFKCKNVGQVKSHVFCTKVVLYVCFVHSFRICFAASNSHLFEAGKPGIQVGTQKCPIRQLKGQQALNLMDK